MSKRWLPITSGVRPAFDTAVRVDEDRQLNNWLVLYLSLAAGASTSSIVDREMKRSQRRSQVLNESLSVSRSNSGAFP